MCRLKRVFAFTVLSLGCGHDDKDMDEHIARVKEKNQELRREVGEKDQERENLEKRYNYSNCDVFKLVKNLGTKKNENL